MGRCHAECDERGPAFLAACANRAARAYAQGSQAHRQARRKYSDRGIGGGNGHRRAEDEEKADALRDEAYRLGEELDEVNAGLTTYSATVRAAAGAVITLDHEGKPCSSPRLPR